MNNDLSTFEIKMTVLTIMGESADVDKAEGLYQWVMEELEIQNPKKAEVTKLSPVN